VTALIEWDESNNALKCIHYRKHKVALYSQLFDLFVKNSYPYEDLKGIISDIAELQKQGLLTKYQERIKEEDGKMSPFIWRASGGREIEVADMKTEHVENAIEWLMMHPNRFASKASKFRRDMWLKIFNEELKTREDYNGRNIR
jgi:hypothetical protein